MSAPLVSGDAAAQILVAVLLAPFAMALLCDLVAFIRRVVR